MFLKTQTDYALRTLLFLAFKGEQASVEEIAKAYRISKEHLFKVIQQLSRLGYVASRAGRNGGIRLVADPAKIRVDTVVGQLEGRTGVLPCVNDPGFCIMEPGCVLRQALIDAEQAFYDTLGKLSIADIVRANESRKTGGVYNLSIRRSASIAPAVLETKESAELHSSSGNRPERETP